MKIINEAKKEKLPLDFLTQYVSRCWGEIGNIKADISAISQTFSSTEKVEKILNNLIDAYLICVGQLEGCVEDKKYLNTELITTDVNVEADKLEEDIGVDQKFTLNEELEEESMQSDVNEELASTNEQILPKDQENIESESFILDFDEPELDEDSDYKKWMAQNK